ncbi:MAG: hypothetical protein COU22_03115 [Candidatus Komeilibacteria bacterium CG10_big_fil_rev_8_21_14_0_10_41_13]|uniref:Type II toxin-antitoxin system HicA family toxin n=1 Tax=Candidatus Komeilibacteria bacterium CG10_big_fil_rev_8_21_14_0_10_41_13 TaxID=1974476 RepID=A0A2M6WBT7_9BACT|nr:MAG: hypothetical protein COU22_03115 [Candidatus Komeilibacteria bacterium CG10_big_fil_rev_8_21_14_0_10_41_13]
MRYSFSRKQCIKSLKKIGFVKKTKRRGKHDKYEPPFILEGLSKNIRPFIMIPRHKFYCQDAIVSEIEKLCGEEMVKKFLNNIK